MAHFAEIDKDNKVIRVLVVPNEFEKDGNKYLSKTLGLGGTWIQTSYNTRGNIHYGQDGQPDNGVALNKNYAGIGYTWDGTGFAAPQPYPSWNMNSTTYLWEAPVAMPTDGNPYAWNESTQSWDIVERMTA